MTVAVSSKPAQRKFTHVDLSEIKELYVIAVIVKAPSISTIEKTLQEIYVELKTPLESPADENEKAGKKNSPRIEDLSTAFRVPFQENPTGTEIAVILRGRESDIIQKMDAMKKFQVKQWRRL